MQLSRYDRINPEKDEIANKETNNFTEAEFRRKRQEEGKISMQLTSRSVRTQWSLEVSGHFSTLG